MSNNVTQLFTLLKIILVNDIHLILTTLTLIASDHQDVMISAVTGDYYDSQPVKILTIT